MTTFREDKGFRQDQLGGQEFERLLAWCDAVERLLPGRRDDIRIVPSDAMQHIRDLRAILSVVSNARGDAASAKEEASQWRQEMFRHAEAVDATDDRWRNHLEICRAAWALCDDTEGTVFADEFGEHYRVPMEAWDRLAAHLSEDPGRLAIAAEASTPAAAQPSGDPS